MKFFIYLLLSFSLLFSASVESKIKKSKKALSSKKIQYKKMDKELSKIAKKINTAKKEQKKLESKLALLSKNIKNNEKTFKALQEKDKEHTLTLEKLNANIEAKHKKFLDLVAKNFSLSLALEELNQPTQESVMMREAYKLYEKKNNEEMETLTRDINLLGKKQNTLKAKKLKIKKVIVAYENDRKEYKAKKVKQDKLVKNLARDKAIYKKRFKKIRASRKSLERKLAKLKIIKRSNDKAVKQRRLEEERIIASNAEAKRVVKTPIKAARATSTAVIVAQYKGGKTISPLKGARLIKKFGTYIDPIYKFKIFNKSITLKAPHRGSKVRSVLAGKVVFAENSGGMLGNVVIVEHANKMHTIYAKLSRLAPTIHVGKRLSSGTVIGKVDKSLMFEVTKNNKHMNPLKLIRL